MFQILLIIIYISFISLGLPDSLLGSAWPSMYQGLGVPISYAGVLSMIIAGCTIISSLFCDRLVRKLGTGLLTAISVAMTAAALFGFSVANSFAMLCIIGIPYGLGAGSVDAALNNFVALHYKAKHMNWLHCFWGVGATIGPYIMGACLVGTSGWHGGYRTIAYIQIILTICLLISLPLWKQKTGEQVDEQEKKVFTLKELFSFPGAKQILIAFFCYCSLESVTGVWASTYMVFTKGIAPEVAASLMALFFLGITGGRFLGGFLTSLFSNKMMIRLGQGAALLGIIILFLSTGKIVMCIGFIMIGIGCAPIYPALLHQTPERFGKEASQSMMGLQMACAYIGSTFAPVVIGKVIEQVSSSLYPAFLVVFVILMILMVEYCNNRKSQSNE